MSDPHAISRRTALAVFMAAMAVAFLASGCGGGTAAEKPAAKPPAEPSIESSAAEGGTAADTAIDPSGKWPAKVADFASKAKIPVWYPSTLPKELKLDAVDVLELEPGTGLVCDAYFVGTDTELGLIQGSPKTREYEIVSLGKVPWGTKTADIVCEDPEDSSSPRMIVYSSKDNLAELWGGASLDQLKAIAASMVLVK
jgi:hypothetical protein